MRDDNMQQKQEQEEHQHFEENLIKEKKMTEKVKNKKLLTPTGFAKWAHVHHPKAAFADKNGKAQGDPKYMIDVCFSPDDPQWKAWATALKAAIVALPSMVDKNTGEVIPKQMPIKRELDIDDKPTGRFYITFKTGEKFKPPLFDKFGVEIPETVLIGNESRVRVSYTPAEYTAFGGGIALYLNAVQVLELVEYGSATADAYGFEVDTLPPDHPFGGLDQDLPFAPHGKCGAGVSWRSM